jgi:hypothetical protein
MKKYLLVLVLFISLAHVADGQGCSVCTKTAAGMDDKSARGLNGGIIYLAFLPLVLIGTVGFAWWRYTRNGGTPGK